MAAYSVFTRDLEPANDAHLDSQESDVVSYRREGRSAMEHAESGGSFEQAISDQIVLRLPDLANSQPTALRLLITPQVFWVAILLGILLAVVLIWGGPKPVSRESDVIPSDSSRAPWMPAAPSDDPFAPDLAPRGIRAARRVDPPRDSGFVPAMPGVATPVGTIITGASE